MNLFRWLQMEWALETAATGFGGLSYNLRLNPRRTVQTCGWPSPLLYPQLCTPQVRSSPAPNTSNIACLALQTCLQAGALGCGRCSRFSKLCRKTRPALLTGFGLRLPLDYALQQRRVADSQRHLHWHFQTTIGRKIKVVRSSQHRTYSALNRLRQSAALCQVILQNRPLSQRDSTRA